MKHKRTKATDIKQATKEIVWERDNRCCVLCGNPHTLTMAHYTSRAQGGLGVEQNIVTLCIVCHHNLDHTVERGNLKAIIKDYLKAKYPDWDESELKYKPDNYTNYL